MKIYFFTLNILSFQLVAHTNKPPSAKTMCGKYPGAWHSFKNAGGESLALVFAVIPNEKQGLLAFFRQIGAAPGKQARPPLSPGQFGRIAAEHDLILKQPSINGDRIHKKRRK